MLLTQLLGQCRTPVKKTVLCNDECSVRMDNVHFGSFRIGCSGGFQQGISCRDWTVFCFPSFRTPTATGNSLFQSEIECSPVNTGLTSGEYFYRMEDHPFFPSPERNFDIMINEKRIPVSNPVKFAYISIGLKVRPGIQS